MHDKECITNFATAPRPLAWLQEQSWAKSNDWRLMSARSKAIWTNCGQNIWWLAHRQTLSLKAHRRQVSILCGRAGCPTLRPDLLAIFRPVCYKTIPQLTLVVRTLKYAGTNIYIIAQVVLKEKTQGAIKTIRANWWALTMHCNTKEKGTRWASNVYFAWNGSV